MNYTMQNQDVEFIVSLDYSLDAFADFECLEWGDLYEELGVYGNDPLILNGDTDFDSDGDYDHYIWNMFAGAAYSSYAIIDHNMIVRYLFDEPDYDGFLNQYIPELVNNMYGCMDQAAINYNLNSVYEDESCVYAGDMDENGYMDVSDVILLLEMILEAEFDISGDLNDDGNTDILDIIDLVNIILA